MNRRSTKKRYDNEDRLTWCRCDWISRWAVQFVQKLRHNRVNETEEVSIFLKDRLQLVNFVMESTLIAADLVGSEQQGANKSKL